MGETFEDYCGRRWGGAGWTHHLKTEGRNDGADFSDWKWWPNTSRAHQLIQFCESNGISSTDHVNALLFRAEYELGENISLVDVLVRIGQEANDNNVGSTNDNIMDDLRRYLTEDEGKARVEQDIAHGRRKYGISSVPYFIVSADEDAASVSSRGDNDKNNRPRQRRPYGFSGAQSSDTFLELFEEIEEQENNS
jgi:predicted DsbA family dithiol-disulfide isomerase